MTTFTDEYGGIYTADRKTLLRCPDVKWYRVAEGTELIDLDAFHHCPILEEVELPYTLKFSYDEMMERCEHDITDEDYAAWLEYEMDHYNREGWDEHQLQEYESKWYEFFAHRKFFIPPSVGHIFGWDRPYAEECFLTDATNHAIEEGEEDEYGVVYSKDGLRVLLTTQKFCSVEDYTVREGVISICCNSINNRMSVNGIALPLTIHLPKSVKNIDQELTDYWFTRQGDDLIFKVEAISNCIR